jgi:WD40 repeat protein
VGFEKTRLLKRLLICLWLLPIFAVHAQDWGADDANRLAILTYLHHDAPIAEAFFSPAGSVFVTGTLNGVLTVWQASEDSRWLRGEARFTAEGYLPGSTVTAFSENEALIAANLGEAGSEIHILNSADGALVVRFEEHQAPLKDILFIQNRTVSLDLNDVLYVWDAVTGEVLHQAENIITFTVSPNQEGMAFLNEDGVVKSLNFDSLEETDWFEAPGSTLISFSPGGRWIAAAGDQLIVWDSRSNNALFEADDFAIDNILWSPDGRFLVTYGFNHLEIWALVRNSAMQPGDLLEDFADLPQQSGLNSVILSPDGTRLVSMDRTGIAQIWAITETGEAEPIRWLSTLTDRVEISPDSTFLVASRQDFPARFWNVVSGDLRSEVALPQVLLFSPDWQLIASYQERLVTWHGIPNEAWRFAFMPIGYPLDRVAIRSTPSEEVAGLQTFNSRQGIFAVGRTSDREWLQILLPDGTYGWVQSGQLDLSTGEDVLGRLPIIQTARTLPQNLEDQTPFLLMPDAGAIDTENGIEGCAAYRTVIVIVEATVEGARYYQVDCGQVVGWLPNTLLEFSQTP